MNTLDTITPMQAEAATELGADARVDDGALDAAGGIVIGVALGLMLLAAVAAAVLAFL